MEDLPPEPWPEFLAEPAAGGYEFQSETLGCSFTVPSEISQKVAVAGGVRYHDPGGNLPHLLLRPRKWAISLNHVLPGGRDAPGGVLPPRQLV